MTKKIIFLITVTLLLSNLQLLASEKQDLWNKAIAEKDLELKYTYLKDFETKYGAKQDKNTMFLFLNLTNTCFLLKKYDESIIYGEKVLTFKELAANYKLQMYLNLANAYNVTKKDIDKAYEYAGLITDLATTMTAKMKEGGMTDSQKFIDQINKYYLGPAYRIQVLILGKKDMEDVEILKKIVEKSTLAYRIDGSSRSYNKILASAYALAKKNLFDEAISSLEEVWNEENPNYNAAQLLASLHYKKKNKEKAVKYYEVNYKLKKKASLAHKIGILTSKTDKEKAIKYFADAYVLQKEDKESDSFKYLQQLWFKELAKDKTPEEQDKGFKQILTEAKSRVGSPEEETGQ